MFPSFSFNSSPSTDNYKGKNMNKTEEAIIGNVLRRISNYSAINDENVFFINLKE